MDPLFCYPGTFSPPTYGHAEIARRAAKLFPELLILCSVNPKKEAPWFTPDKCAALWRAHKLPPNVRIGVFNGLTHDPDAIVLVRGLRDPQELLDEADVVALNAREFGIRQYAYILTPDRFRGTSSTRVRNCAIEADLEGLKECVPPLVVTAVLEKAHKLKNLILVVGKPGGGKSTFLKRLTSLDSRNIHVNTDVFTLRLRMLLRRHFGKDDFLDLVLHEEERVLSVVRGPWMAMLRQSLKSARPDANLFLEIPFALQQNKQLYRYVGGKILYVGCDGQEQRRRIKHRRTPQHALLSARIPGLAESKQIAAEEGLSLTSIDTRGSLDDLAAQAQTLNAMLQNGGDPWKHSSATSFSVI